MKSGSKRTGSTYMMEFPTSVDLRVTKSPKGIHVEVSVPVDQSPPTWVKQDEMTICFISQDADHGWMSNYYEGAPFPYAGFTWPTSEHAFQAAKVSFHGQWVTRILNAQGPNASKRLGRQCPLRKDWETVKVGIMRNIVQAKIKAHPELQDKLLATGTARLEEDAHWDRFWGTGKTGPGGNGENLMGKILMDLRDSLHRHRSKEQ